MKYRIKANDKRMMYNINWKIAAFNTIVYCRLYGQFSSHTICQLDNQLFRQLFGEFSNSFLQQIQEKLNEV